jgi:hypothetical protein
MTEDQRTWTHAGLDEAARLALSRGLGGSQLWSLLLGVLDERAARRTTSQLLRQWETDRFVKPSYIDQRTAMELDTHLLAAAAGFESLELSPLAPLGTCSLIAVTSQNRTVSTIRGTEVVSDPTNVLALECARRLRKEPNSIVHLVTSHRCVRAQQFPQRPGFAAHFRIFCLASAGHERVDRNFTVESLARHVRTHWAALDRLEPHGYAFSTRRVRLLATAENRSLAERIEQALSGIALTLEELEHPYYAGLRFMVDVRTPEGAEVPLIDGGVFNWLHALAANRKLTFIASGMGSQLAAYLFRVPGAGSAGREA